MESEKVKAIKKALEQNIKSGLGYEDNDTFCNIMFADILTLINELEAENERLSSIYRNLEINYNDTWEHYREYEVENQQLKDRIVKLEKDNELLRNAKVIYETVDYCAEDLRKAEKRIKELEKEHIIIAKKYIDSECNKKLKQFAERLKEKRVDYYTKGIIDETLEEFIDEEKKRKGSCRKICKSSI